MQCPNPTEASHHTEIPSGPRCLIVLVILTISASVTGLAFRRKIPTIPLIKLFSEKISGAYRTLDPAEFQ